MKTIITEKNLKDGKKFLSEFKNKTYPIYVRESEVFAYRKGNFVVIVGKEHNPFHNIKFVGL